MDWSNFKTVKRRANMLLKTKRTLGVGCTAIKNKAGKTVIDLEAAKVMYV